MRPIPFKYANAQLNPPDADYSADVASVSPLPIWTNGEQCVSCWKMSLWERIVALFVGRVWLAVLSGYRQPPVSLTVARTYLKEADK
jgi:hypothetical protein